MLSVLMVTWNRLYYTLRAVESIFENTTSAYELVIVDNGSTDGTKTFLEYLAEKETNIVDSGLRVLYNEENIGLAPALNRALNNSCGEFVAFAGNDLVVPWGWSATLIEAYVKAESAKIGWLNPIVEGEVPWKLPNFKIEGYSYLKGPPVAGACGITRRTILEEIGGFQSSRYLYGGVDGLTLGAIRKTGRLTCWLENVTVVHLESGDRDRYPEYHQWKVNVQAHISKHSTEDIPGFEWTEESTS